MLSVKGEVYEHKYSSSPTEWVMMDTNIAYWLHPSSNAQIHLIGNIVTWTLATVGLAVFASFFLWHLLRQQRKIEDIPEATRRQLTQVGVVCGGGWAVNYLPFFIMEKTLFLYHYLPALIFKILLLSAVLEHLHAHILRYPSHRCALDGILMAGLFSIYLSYRALSPLTYGQPELSSEDLASLHWKDTWDILLRKH